LEVSSGWKIREDLGISHGTTTALGTCRRCTFRGHRGRHAEKERTTKARNHSWVAEAGRHSEALRITSRAGKSQCAGKWSGWGRLSVDGPGQYNPARSEGPWGRVAQATRTAVLKRASYFDSERRNDGATQSTKGEGKLGDVAYGRRAGRPRLTGRP